MKIGVIVLHYRNLCDTLECLGSLVAQDYLHYEILLIDNGSDDLDLEHAVSGYPDVHYVRNKDNLGYAEGNNVGIRLALQRGVDAVLLLNNDTTVSSDLLTAFANAASSHPEAGAFGAKILYYDEPTVIWHAGGNLSQRTYRCFHEGCPDLEERWNTSRPIAYACGCALFIKKETLEKIGLLAPEFFLLWEEIDWCWRLKKAGGICLYVPEAKVWHKISRAFEGGNRGPLWQYYYFRNRLLFLRRHISLPARLFFYLTVFPKELLQLSFGTLFSTAPKRVLHRFALKGITHHFLGKFFKYTEMNSRIGNMARRRPEFESAKRR